VYNQIIDMASLLNMLKGGFQIGLLDEIEPMVGCEKLRILDRFNVIKQAYPLHPNINEIPGSFSFTKQILQDWSTNDTNGHNKLIWEEVLFVKIVISVHVGL
jgi:hypothetical protein